MELADRVLKGDVRAAANLMRGIEDGLPEAVKELKKIYKNIGKAFTIGVTGAAGVGKSTLVDCLITEFRQKQMTVGVVAVDPTSPFTGGAILGDRLRMARHCTDKGVFIRSLASRGWTGGLSRATIGIIHVLDAMGKNIILVETVGSGQGEVSVYCIADTTIVVLAPGLGDDIQMMKAGILETADIYVINKADRDGAENLRIQIETMMAMRGKAASGWIPDVVLTQATNGTGVDVLAEVVLKHKRYLESSGEITHKMQERAKLELTEAIEQALRIRVNDQLETKEYDRLIESMATKETDPYTLAERIVSKILPR